MLKKWIPEKIIGLSKTEMNGQSRKIFANFESVKCLRNGR